MTAAGDALLSFTAISLVGSTVSIAALSCLGSLLVSRKRNEDKGDEVTWSSERSSTAPTDHTALRGQDESLDGAHQRERWTKDIRCRSEACMGDTERQHSLCMSYTRLSDKQTALAIRKAYKWNLMSLFNTDPKDYRQIHQWQSDALSDFDHAARLVMRSASGSASTGNEAELSAMALCGASLSLGRSREMTQSLLHGMGRWRPQYDALFAGSCGNPIVERFEQNLIQWEDKGMVAMLQMPGTRIRG